MATKKKTEVEAELDRCMELLEAYKLVNIDLQGVASQPLTGKWKFNLYFRRINKNIRTAAKVADIRHVFLAEHIVESARQNGKDINLEDLIDLDVVHG